MSDSCFPTIGPGQMDMCRECVVQRQHEKGQRLERRQKEVDHLIADEVEKKPELLNGNDYLHDLIKIRRDECDAKEDVVPGRDYPFTHRENS